MATSCRSCDKGVTRASKPHACSPNYKGWFRCMSHPYLILGSDSNIVARYRRHSLDE